MSTGKRVLPAFKDPLMTNQSMAASINGTPTFIQNLDNVVFQMSWTGSNPTGTIVVQVSLDYNPNTNIGTWTTVQSTPGVDLSLSPGGAPGNAIFDLNGLPETYARLQYTTAGGSSGNLTSVISGKAI